MMTAEAQPIVSEIVMELETAWNAADGDAFARPFAEDADFVNIRGEHHRTRGAIAVGHHAILSTIYKGSVVRFQVAAVRPIAPGVILTHVKSVLNAPAGPLAGEHHALFSMVIVQSAAGWSIASFHNTLAS
jgi:uncharacterized protein (TIGR02246 family)